LAAYRKHCASNLPNGQLVLPDSFKLLPLLCLALSKSTALSQAPVTVDLRACEIYRLLSLSMTEMFNLLYPRIMRFGFDNALSHGGEPLSKSLTVRPTRLSRDSLNTNAIFAIPIANRLLIWISSQVHPSLLAEIFGNPNISAIQPEAYTQISSFPPPSGEASATFRRMIEEIASKCTGRSSTPIILIRFSLDSNEVDFMNLLVEDGQASIGPSYVDFLCRLHNQINHEMNSSSLAERTALLSFLQ
jgi:protein transport protein SEC24